MGIIKVLDKSVANMIAAGEVVERPASVVKELLENSIDAGATHITTEIKNGGIKFIRVLDNGCGMTADDAECSLLRHATSKIGSAGDLEKIMTLGFRGEALASIAAVSNLDIYTKTNDDEIGTHLISRPGEEVCQEEAGCPAGTTILVRDLFLVAPARMKFLKKDYTEAGYIADIVNRLALGMPHISFKFINNDKEQLFTSGDGDLKGVVRAVYGKDIAGAMIECDYNEGGVRAFGLCGKAEAARANRANQSFFINGRYIKSALLIRAVEEAYKNELMTGKFPSCVINIEVQPQMVDINVHPTKLEAKFADEAAVYHAVYWAVKNALYEKKTIPRVTASPNPGLNVKIKEAEQVNLSASFGAAPVRGEIKPAISMKEYDVAKKKTEPDIMPQDPVLKDAFKFDFTDKVPDKKTVSQEKEVSGEKQNSQEPPDVPKENAGEAGFSDAKDLAQKTAEIEKSTEMEYKICGQIFNTYIIVEKDGEMLLVDQHAAHERLRYEKLLLQYEQRSIVSQTLLCPQCINLSALEFAAAREHKDALLDLGFSIDEFGENVIKINAIPFEAEDADCEDLFLEVLKNLTDNKKSSMTESVKNALYQISCKGAVKANMKLSTEEMKTLLDSVFSLSGINTCPHGRPITISFTKYFIEKQFKRIV